MELAVNSRMDHIDKKILAELQKNAKQNTKEIASKVGLSVTPTYERIKKMEQHGIIESYVAILNKSKIGKKITAFCQVNLLQHSRGLIDNFKNLAVNFPEIIECHHISGNYDFLLKIVVNDINDFHEFINKKLATVDGISKIQSSFVMNTVFESTEIDV